MRLFISGKISGDANYIEKFSKAEETIKKELHAEVINPACLRLPESCTWDDYMKITMELLSLADGVVLLPDWRKSPGACMECGYALATDKTILHYKDMVGADVPDTDVEKIATPKAVKLKEERICKQCGKPITGRGKKILCDECKESKKDLPG